MPERTVLYDDLDHTVDSPVLDDGPEPAMSAPEALCVKLGTIAALPGFWWTDDEISALRRELSDPTSPNHAEAFSRASTIAMIWFTLSGALPVKAREAPGKPFQAIPKVRVPKALLSDRVLDRVAIP
jgi:hypothetical protein